MQTSNNVLELIGNTPLIRINRISCNIKSNVFAKSEFLNPSGSLKDRIALEMIEQAEREGKLRSGYTIIESSTGNTGIALSFVGNVKGYHVIIFETMPEKIGVERRRIMERYGAEVRLLDAASFASAKEKSVSGAEVELPGRALCREMEKSKPNVWWARQFSNPANVKSHNKTGREILKQLDNKVDVFVASIGTGGTLMGIAEVLKEKIPEVKIIGIQPKSDKIPIVVGKPYPKTEISGGIISEMLERELVDEIVRVGDEEAVNAAHELWKKEGLFCGISSGANVFVAIKEAKKRSNGNVVTILPDNGDRYLTEEHFIT